jgi:hypothetical protein
MPIRLFHLYQRKRVININVNAVIAGLLGMVPAGLVVLYAESILPPEPHWPFPVIAIVADVVFDVVIYFALHWFANHWRPGTGRSERDRKALEAKPPPFFRDAILVQIERAILSPLFYVVSGGIMHFLQIQGMRPSSAFLIAFPCGLVCTRLAHTLWGLKSGSFHDHDVRQAKHEAREQSPHQSDL